MTVKLEKSISTWWRKYRIVTSKGGAYQLEIRYFMDPRGWMYVNACLTIQPLIDAAERHAQAGRVVLEL